MNIAKSGRQGARGAYLLIESLVYFGVVVVLLAVAYVAMDRCINSSIRLRRAADDIGSALRVGERWRVDVRKSTAAQFEEIEGTRVLRLNTPQGTIQYKMVSGTLYRRVADGTWVAVLQRVRALTMEKDTRRQVAAWRCELELEPRSKYAKVLPLFTFLAVPATSTP